MSKIILSCYFRPIASYYFITAVGDDSHFLNYFQTMKKSGRLKEMVLAMDGSRKLKSRRNRRWMGLSIWGHRLTILPAKLTFLILHAFCNYLQLLLLLAQIFLEPVSSSSPFCTYKYAPAFVDQ